jgi:hypothetical protein
MNPFEKRATEFIPDDVAFLPYVTPEPLVSYLQRYAQQDVLFDRLVVLIGTPGSGKTTLARLFLLPTLTTLLRTPQLPSQASLMDALRECNAIQTDNTPAPAVAGCRIPLESNYRDCWELPYPEDVRQNLFCSLLQARTVLAWLRGMDEAGYPLEDVKLIPRADAGAALDAIGGESLERMRELAREIERDVYRVTAGLLPPPLENLPAGARAAYHPFDVIEAFEIPFGGQRLRVKPLVICDDAHFLHPMQLDGVIKWFARREVRVARWMLTRIDALRPHEVLRPEGGLAESEPGFNRGREMVRIWMQSSTEDRRANRVAFRRIAKDMSARYLQQMPIFVRHNLKSLEELLETTPPPLAPGKLKQLQDSLTSGPRRHVGADQRREIEGLVDTYLGSERRRRASGDATPDLRAMMIRVLLERYLKRVPQSSLFDDAIDVRPSVPLKVDADVRNAAEMHLYHEFGRPYFYGFETLCDAASENAERFLRLAGRLVAQLETQIIRRASVTLSPDLQDELLKERATRMIDEEDLPERSRVLNVCESIAAQCLVVTHEPNAPLAQGPNAWGILQTEFDTITTEHPELARVLQSGLAYNMFTLVRDYGTKGQIWCLVELSGTWSLKWGLSLGRGGFLERRVEDLLKTARLPPGETV